MRTVRALRAALLLSAAALAGCGQSGDDDGTDNTNGAAETSAAFPVSVAADNGSVEIAERPQRIVSLSATATETLFAIGAGDQVTAVDDRSDHPEEAPRSDLSGFKPNAEAVIGHDPDLVVVAEDHDGIVTALEKVKIPVLLEKAATEIDQVYDQIADLGAATGNVEGADEVTGRLRQRVDAAVRAAPTDSGLTYYHEVGPELYSATSDTFAGQVYGLFGLDNIADEADKQGSGYPQLSAEHILQADPDLIFLADTECCDQSAATLRKRSGWQNLKALDRGAVIELDDDLAARWGPRLADFAEAVSEAVREHAAG